MSLVRTLTLVGLGFVALKWWQAKKAKELGGAELPEDSGDVRAVPAGSPSAVVTAAQAAATQTPTLQLQQAAANVRKEVQASLEKGEQAFFVPEGVDSTPEYTLAKNVAWWLKITFADAWLVPPRANYADLSALLSVATGSNLPVQWVAHVAEIAGTNFWKPGQKYLRAAECLLVAIADLPPLPDKWTTPALAAGWRDTILQNARQRLKYMAGQAGVTTPWTPDLADRE